MVFALLRRTSPYMKQKNAHIKTTSLKIFEKQSHSKEISLPAVFIESKNAIEKLRFFKKVADLFDLIACHEVRIV